MGFTVNNSFGKFQAETHLPLPTFSAESLMSLSSKQFGAATIDAANITNYDDAVFSRFNVGDGGTGGGAGTVNKNGGIVTAYDKGFHFTLDPAAAVESQVVNLSQTGSKTFSFTLKPGDQLYRDGRNRSVIYEPADGDKVTTLHNLCAKAQVDWGMDYGDGERELELWVNDHANVKHHWSSGVFDMVLDTAIDFANSLIKE